MNAITDELLEALRSVAGGCGRWVENDPRIIELLKLELVMWADWRPEFEGDPTSGPAWVTTRAGDAYLAGYQHSSTNRLGATT